MGSRIVCCFVLYSAFDSKIMQLANHQDAVNRTESQNQLTPDVIPIPKWSLSGIAYHMAISQQLSEE